MGRPSGLIDSYHPGAITIGGHLAKQQQEALVLRKRAVAEMIGISTATLDRLRAAGSFVRPIQLGEQAIGWLRADIDAWLASRPLVHHFVESLEY